MAAVGKSGKWHHVTVIRVIRNSERDVVDWFKSRGKGNLTCISAVLRAYGDAQKGALKYLNLVRFRILSP